MFENIQRDKEEKILENWYNDIKGIRIYIFIFNFFGFVFVYKLNLNLNIIFCYGIYGFVVFYVVNN